MIPAQDVTTFHLQTESIPWAKVERPWGATHMKLVRCSLTEDSYTNIVRWPAGLRLAAHHHYGHVSGFTLEGSWRYLEYDWVATPGSFVFEPPGTFHRLDVLEDTMALFTTHGAMDWVDDEGNVTRHQTAATVLEDCRAALARDGLVLPDEVVV